MSRKDKGDDMKANLMPLKGEAARNFEKFASSNKKPKTRKTSKAKRERIIAFFNSVKKMNQIINDYAYLEVLHKFTYARNKYI